MDLNSSFEQLVDEDEVRYKVVQQLNAVFGRDVKNLGKASQLYQELLVTQQQLEKRLRFATTEAPDKISKAVKVAEVALEKKDQLLTQCQEMREELTDHKSSMADLMEEIGSGVREVREIERVQAYLQWLQAVEEQSSEIESSLSISAEGQAMVGYKRLSDAACVVKDTTCKHLFTFVRETLLHWHGVLKDRFTKEFELVLKAIKWPFTNQTVHQPPASQEQLQRLDTLTQYLLQLTLPRGISASPPSTPSPMPPITVDFPQPTLPLQLLLRPLQIRFVYHFSSNKATNSREHPEWYLTRVLKWIEVHEDFLAKRIQPVLNRCGHQRCLTKVLNIELWRLYVTYVKETKSSLPTYKEKLSQAYEFAIDKIGMDYNSYTLWNDYANLLKHVEVVGSYAENQKIMAVRKVYQRGIVTPMANIEQLWKDYLDFEKSINPIIAEKMNIERGRDYMNARRVGKEMEAETRGLNRHLPSVPPSGLPEETKQVEIWKRYIRWEKENPLRTDDQTLVTKRVRFAYEQCLLCLSHHPDIWYEAALYLQESSKLLSEKGDVNASKIFSDEAAQIYERAISGPLRTNQLLYFAYADFEESRLRYQEVHKIYQRFIEIQDIDPTLAYIQYMKFARRAEGIKSTREVFKKAREDQRTRFHVYVAAALMEYYCTKNKDIAFRIFELGLKKFPDDADYIMAYVDYLSHLNEDNTTRVLFERVLSSGQLKNEDSVGLWNRFLEFECNVGDLASIVKVEKRRAQVLQKLQEFEGKDTAQLVDRYKFMDLYPCTPTELKAVGYRDISTHATIINPNIPRGLSIHDSQEPNYPKPDFSQMIPFKPKAKYIPGEHPVPGAGFPPPPTVANLLSLLPPPNCFRGPFVKLDALLDLFMRINLPEQGDKWSTASGHDVRLFELSKSVHWVVDGNDRKRKLMAADDSDDDDGTKPVLSSDIYRARQQKKIR